MKKNQAGIGAVPTGPSKSAHTARVQADAAKDEERAKAREQARQGRITRRQKEKLERELSPRPQGTLRDKR